MKSFVEVAITTDDGVTAGTQRMRYYRGGAMQAEDAGIADVLGAIDCICLTDLAMAVVVKCRGTKLDESQDELLRVCKKYLDLPE